MTSKTVLFKQANFSIARLMTRFKSTLYHSMQLKESERDLAFNMDLVEKTAIFLNLDAELLKACFKDKIDEYNNKLKNWNNIHALSDEERQDFITDLLHNFEANIKSNIKSRAEDKILIERGKLVNNLKSARSHIRKKLNTGQADDYLSEEDKISLFELIQNTSMITPKKEKEIRQENPLTYENILKELKEKNVYNKEIDISLYQPIIDKLPDNHDLKYNINTILNGHNKRVNSDGHLADTHKLIVRNARIVAVESIFKIPLHNEVSLEPHHRKEIIESFLKKIYPDHDILFTFYHGNERTKSGGDKDFGDHVHAFLSGENRRTHAYDIPARNAEIAEQYAKEHGMVLPSEIEHWKARNAKIGEYRQRLFYDHLNAYAKEHNLNLQFAILEKTEENREKRDIISKNNSKKSKYNRVFNLHNMAIEELQSLRITTSNIQKDQNLVMAVMQPQLEIFLKELELLYTDNFEEDFLIKSALKKTEIEKYLQEQQLKLNDPNYIAYSATIEIISKRMESYDTVRNKIVKTELEIDKKTDLLETLGTRFEELNTNYEQLEIEFNEIKQKADEEQIRADKIDQKAKEAIEKTNEKLKTAREEVKSLEVVINSLNAEIVKLQEQVKADQIKKDITAISANNNVKLIEAEQRGYENAKQQLTKEFIEKDKAKTQSFNRSLKERDAINEDLFKRYNTFTTMFSGLFQAVLMKNNKLIAEELGKSKDAIYDTITVYTKELETAKRNGNREAQVQYNKLLTEFTKAIMAVEKQVGINVLKDEHRKGYKLK